MPIPGHPGETGTLEIPGRLAHDVVHFAPPPSQGTRDTRTARLLATLTKNFTILAHPHQYLRWATAAAGGKRSGLAGTL